MEEKLTPMLQQYTSIKRQHPNVILLFRLGDFYEMFGDDAETAAPVLDLVLTGRDAGSLGRIPMCGVPYHSVDKYIAKLVASGYRVAICDQMEDPRFARGLVRRQVTRVVTPGTVLEDSMLDAKSNNYLAAVAVGSGGYGLSIVDVSTGEFLVTQLDGETAEADLLNELQRLMPAEVLTPAEAEAVEGGIRKSLSLNVTPREKARKRVATKNLLLPVLLPGGEECAHCADKLKDQMLALAGVRAAAVDRETHQLVLTYDPTLISPEQIEQEARTAGEAIAQHVRHEALVLRGMDCPDCALKIERAVCTLPGVSHVATSFAASRLDVEYDERESSHAAIARTVAGMGYRVEEAQAPIQSGVLQVSGMDCPDCAERVERAVMLLSGARSVRVNFTTGRMELQYDPAVLSLDQVARAIREAGYEVRIEGGQTHDPEIPAFWEKNSRLSLSLFSGAAFFVGLAISLFKGPAYARDFCYLLA
ncbi:MAG TPA: copper ion binding protein, partial [Armatimonadota bacterium]|nr:copper ion binding protein [Armatimonadota bacterium]